MGLFSKNEVITNPDMKVLGNLSTNQKMSCKNFLCFIARSDGDFNQQEINFLNDFKLDVSVDACLAYFDHGIDNMYNDLKWLKQNQKDYLICTAYDLINCDGPRNEKKMLVFTDATKQLGYDTITVMSVIQRYVQLKKQFSY